MLEEYKNWKSYYEKALANTREVLHDNSKAGTLIEVSAQHPLVNGQEPNEEYKARLDKAIELYHLLKKDNTRVKIYTTGSRHTYNGVADIISLSTAGRRYLCEQGISLSDIYGGEVEHKYMQESGIYCSEDECKATYKLFCDTNYQKLICVCSPIQLMRKYLYYIKLEIAPDMVSVPCENMFHDPIEEIFVNIPKVIYNDTFEIEKVRKERMPT
jgi:hypothetical protein